MGWVGQLEWSWRGPGCQARCVHSSGCLGTAWALALVTRCLCAVVDVTTSFTSMGRGLTSRYCCTAEMFHSVPLVCLFDTGNCDDQIG